jgi:hypothetical protein
MTVITLIETITLEETKIKEIKHNFIDVLVPSDLRVYFSFDLSYAIFIEITKFGRVQQYYNEVILS